jgi:predicted anti-sigma-YlaC factor YlaD
MKKTRNRITDHKTNCPECSHHYNPIQLQDIMYEQGQEAINLKCFCGQRSIIRENINGWLVMRKYIKKKDQVKRIKI